MPADPALPEEEILVEYVRRALDARERGEDVDLREVCRDRPELQGAVAEILGLGNDLSALRDPGPAEAGDRRVLAGRYRLDTPLGRGAMGVVWEATDLELRRPVAVKLFETLGRPQPNDDERFRREAEVLAALQHDHVVAIHDRGQDEDGTLFLVMERLRGASLAELMERAAGERREGARFAEWLAEETGGFDREPPESTWTRAVVRWCADVATGLAAAHERGVFHRDVKPSNVFVRRDLRAVLLDFGIAARAGDPALTAVDSSLGTPWYMAPEQVAGKARANAVIDVYGLTSTLYHLLTGRPPYDGDAVQVVAKLQRDDPLPPGAARPDLPRDLCAILERGMERDPARRYPTIRHLEADLRAFLAGEPVSARPLTRFGRLVRRARRAPAKALAVGASAVAVVLLAVVLPLWSASAARARTDERNELFATLPALLAIEGLPHQRLLQDAAERDRSLAVLDRMLELDPGDLPNRLWRAALRVDQGQHDEAAADLREIVAHSGDSAYVRAIAERYLDADPATLGTESIDLTGLPDPVTTFDRFVAGFHELRNRHVDGFADRAFDLLDPIAESYPPARELRIMVLLYLGDSRHDAAAFQKAVDDTRWLEGFYGQPTARTLALRGAALTGLGRFEEAVEDLLKADELRPNRHGPIHNLGVAYRRLGDYVKAQECLERAHELRPHFWNSTYMLALLHKDRGDFERAEALADALADDLPPSQAWRLPEVRGTIRLRRAIDAWQAGDGEAARAMAEQAAERFAAAIELADGDNVRNKLAIRRETAAYVAAEDAQGAARVLAILLRLTPDDPYEIANLASLLPEEGLDADATAWVRSWMRRLARALAKGDPAFQRAQEAQRKAEESR